MLYSADYQINKQNTQMFWPSEGFNSDVVFSLGFIIASVKWGRYKASRCFEILLNLDVWVSRL